MLFSRADPCPPVLRTFHFAQGPYVPSRAHVAAAGGVAATTLGLYTYSYGLPRPSAIVEALAANGLIAEASANTIGEEGFHPADYDFYHKGYLNTFDHASSVFSPSFILGP